MALLVCIQCCILLYLGPGPQTGLVAVSLLFTARRRSGLARLCLVGCGLIQASALAQIFNLYILLWPSLWLQVRNWPQHKATVALALLAAFNPLCPDLYVQTLSQGAAMFSVARWYGARLGEIDRYLLLASTTLSLNKVVWSYFFHGCRLDSWLFVLSLTSLALLPAYILRGLVVRKLRTHWTEQQPEG